MTAVTESTIAALAHTYASAVERMASLESQPHMTARRLQEAVFAQACAETIVLLTDDGDWRTRARKAKDDREKILMTAGRLVSKGVKAEQSAEIRTLTIPPEGRSDWSGADVTTTGDPEGAWKGRTT